MYGWDDKKIAVSKEKHLHTQRENAYGIIEAT